MSQPQQQIDNLNKEVTRLKSELDLRDQLVQQLSQELFRLVKGNANYVPQPEANEAQQEEFQLLREQMEEMEEQVKFYQEQISSRDTDIYQLRQSVQELSDRSRMLEQVVQELPHIYKDKFAQRMIPIKTKVEQLQRENRQLHAELQSVSYRLAVRSRLNSNAQIRLPNFDQMDSLNDPIPSFGNV